METIILHPKNNYDYSDVTLSFDKTMFGEPFISLVYGNEDEYELLLSVDQAKELKKFLTKVL